MRKTEELRRLLKSDGFLFTSGVATPMQAKILERIGFKLAHVSGYSCSMTYLAISDVGLLTGTEMITNASYIANAVNIPVIADADNAYGNAINAMRTVRDYERAGIAGIHIEDQIVPKRCGHLAGKLLVPLEEATGKIKAACDAREDKDFVIIARTDARGAVNGNIKEAIRRAKAYADAGADMLFGEFTSPDAIEDVALFAREIHKDWPDIPLMFNYSSAFNWFRSRHKLSFKQLAEMGYKLIFVSMGLPKAGLRAEWEYAKALFERMEKGEFEFEEMNEGHPTENHHEFSGFKKIKELELKYLPKEDVAQKYQKSIGYK